MQIALRPGLALLLTLCALLAGCASSGSGLSKEQALAGLTWPYAAGALQLHVNSDKALNSYDGEAHSVALAIVQSADPNEFKQMQQDAGQLAALLQGDKPASTLLQVNRFAVEPTTQASVRLDRAQGARYIGVIVGYYGTSPARGARLLDWPVHLENRGWVFSDYVASPAQATLGLQLGPESLLDASISESVPASQTAVSGSSGLISLDSQEPRQ